MSACRHSGKPFSTCMHNVVITKLNNSTKLLHGLLQHLLLTLIPLSIAGIDGLKLRLKALLGAQKQYWSKQRCKLVYFFHKRTNLFTVMIVGLIVQIKYGVWIIEIYTIFLQIIWPFGLAIIRVSPYSYQCRWYRTRRVGSTLPVVDEAGLESGGTGWTLWPSASGCGIARCPSTAAGWWRSRYRRCSRTWALCDMATSKNKSSATAAAADRGRNADVNSKL